MRVPIDHTIPGMVARGCMKGVNNLARQRMQNVEDSDSACKPRQPDASPDLGQAVC